VMVRLEHDAARFAQCVAPLGEVSAHGRELTMPDLGVSLVPDVVNTLVAAGARIVAVEPGRTSLEDRLLELLASNEEEPLQ